MRIRNTRRRRPARCQPSNKACRDISPARQVTPEKDPAVEPWTAKSPFRVLVLQPRSSESPKRPNYRYGLALTSQFYFCGLPLKLDTYSKCSFKCSYCFAHARGGAHREAPVSAFDADLLDRQLDRIKSGRVC